MSPKPIRTKPDKDTRTLGLKLCIGGWFQGEDTFLWFGEPDTTGHFGRCYGTLSKRRLYRLAKAIVRQFESQNPKGNIQEKT